MKTWPHVTAMRSWVASLHAEHRRLAIASRTTYVIQEKWIRTQLIPGRWIACRKQNALISQASNWAVLFGTVIDPHTAPVLALKENTCNQMSWPPLQLPAALAHTTLVLGPNYSRLIAATHQPCSIQSSCAYIPANIPTVHVPDHISPPPRPAGQIIHCDINGVLYGGPGA